MSCKSTARFGRLDFSFSPRSFRALLIVCAVLGAFLGQLHVAHAQNWAWQSLPTQTTPSGTFLFQVGTDLIYNDINQLNVLSETTGVVTSIAYDYTNVLCKEASTDTNLIFFLHSVTPYVRVLDRSSRTVTSSYSNAWPNRRTSGARCFAIGSKLYIAAITTIREIFDASSNTWSDSVTNNAVWPTGSPTSNTASYPIGVCNNRLYTIMPSSSGNSIFVYQNNDWTSGSATGASIAVSSPTGNYMACVSTKLLLGYDSSPNKVIVVDMATSPPTPSAAASMSGSSTGGITYGPPLLTLGTKVYSIGYDSPNQDKMDIYDSTTNGWTSTAVSGSINVLSFATIDPTTNSKYTTRMPIATTGYIGNYLVLTFFISATNPQDLTPMTVLYDTVNNAWSALPLPNYALPGGAGAVVAPFSSANRMITTNIMAVFGCPIGTYQTGANTCTNCPATQVSGLFAGATFCKDCAAGSFSSNSQLCVSCSAGSYAATAGLSACTLCPAGQGTGSATGQTSCTPCPAGSTDTNCGTCPAGTYSATSGAAGCTTCPAGSVSSAGATSCSQCPAGTFANGGTCSDCPAGKFNAMSGQTACQDCAIGSFAANFRQASCAQCPAGRFAVSTGSQACSICAGGTYSLIGASGCLTCGTGQFSDSDSSACKDCAPGVYNNVTGSTTCRSCPSSQFTSSVRSASCSQCPKGSTCFVGSIAPVVTESLPTSLRNWSSVDPFQLDYGKYEDVLVRTRIILLVLGGVFVVLMLAGTWLAMLRPDLRARTSLLVKLDLFFSMSHSTPDGGYVSSKSTQLGGFISIACMTAILFLGLLLGYENLYKPNSVTSLKTGALAFEPHGMFRLTVDIFGGGLQNCANASSSIQISYDPSDWQPLNGQSDFSIQQQLVDQGTCRLVWQCTQCFDVAFPTATIKVRSTQSSWANYIQYRLDLPVYATSEEDWSASEFNGVLVSVNGNVFPADKLSNSVDMYFRGAQTSITEVPITLTPAVIQRGDARSISFDPSIGIVKRGGVASRAQFDYRSADGFAIDFKLNRNSLNLITVVDVPSVINVIILLASLAGSVISGFAALFGVMEEQIAKRLGDDKLTSGSGSDAPAKTEMVEMSGGKQLDGDSDLQVNTSSSI